MQEDTCSFSSIESIVTFRRCHVGDQFFKVLYPSYVDGVRDVRTHTGVLAQVAVLELWSFVVGPDRYRRLAFRTLSRLVLLVLVYSMCSQSPHRRNRGLELFLGIIVFRRSEVDIG
jgi:hypothetical protein